jgi:competence protein ComEC
MSFAGALALIAAFDGLRTRAWWTATLTDDRWRFVRPALGAFVTSLVAGVATGPFSVYHFNVIAQYGLLANMLAMPAMGLVVMPAAVVALFTAPFGLDWVPLMAAGSGITYFLWVSEWVAGLGGATSGVKAGPPVALGLLAVGGLVLALGIGRLRWAGLAPIGLAFALWVGDARPPLLIAENGRLFGIMTERGRALSVDRGLGFVAGSWLEDDGDLATQEEAHARLDFKTARARIAAPLPGFGEIVYIGRKETDPAECTAGRILIAPNWPRAPDGPCVFVGAERLRRDGALAVRFDAVGPVLTGALSANRTRLWTRDPRDAFDDAPGEPPAPLIAAAPAAED